MSGLYCEGSSVGFLWLVVVSQRQQSTGPNRMDSPSGWVQPIEPSQLGAWCLSAQRFGDALNNLLLRGEAVPSLRGDDFPGDGDLENPGVALHQRGVDAEFLFQCSRRTGGLGEVPSGGAVGDGDHVKGAS